MSRLILPQLQELRQKKKKAFAVLIDPDKVQTDQVLDLTRMASACGVSFFFVGGSLLTNDHIQQVVPMIKLNCNIPVILFPGSIYQIVPTADAIFFLSLISGRNPELLIGQQVLAAPLLKNSQLEVIGTGYMLIESGNNTTVNYISGTQPIPRHKPEIASCTAMAGEMLGLSALYMDGGSGAKYPISSEMISAVRKHTDIPLIVGGGIRSVAEAERIWQAGADVIVIGNAIEQNGGSLMQEVAALQRVLS